MKHFEITAEMADTLADWFRAMSDPNRIRLLAYLKEYGEVNVGVLSDSLGLSQTSTSKHLAILRAARIVQTRRAGTTIFYALCDESIPQICSIVCNNVLDHQDRLRAGIRSSRLNTVKSTGRRTR
jgi:DNA-binding transcriptional ArsR family regulator